MQYRVIGNKLGDIKVQVRAGADLPWGIECECPEVITLEQAKEWIQSKLREIEIIQTQVENSVFDTVLYQAEINL